LEKKVYFHSCESMKEVDDQTAKLVIISPPLANNAQEEKLNKAHYLEFLEVVLSEVFRILKTDGILVSVNTDLRDHSHYNNGDSNFEGTVWFKHTDIRHIAEQTGFKCIDSKIWVKSLNVNLYRYNFAYILFFSKREKKPFRPGMLRRNNPFKADVWFLPNGTQRKASNGYRFRNAIHPEIVERCIDEFTVPGDTVVSPFTGSGTILAVAEIMGRKWAGYEVDENLKGLIDESIHGPIRPSIYKHLLDRYQKF
jgi:DNA modification methylase